MSKNTHNEHIECEWSHMVSSSSIDQNTNSLSLFNMIEEINGEVQVPFGLQKAEGVIPISYEVVSMWQRKGSAGKELEGDVRVDLVYPSGRETEAFEYKIVIPADKERIRFVANVQGIKFEDNGKYKLVIKLKQGTKFNEVSSIPLIINVKKIIIDTPAK